MRRFSCALGVMMALASVTDAYCQNRSPSGSGFGGSTSAPSYGNSGAGGSAGMFGSRSLGSSLSAGSRGFSGGGARGGGVGVGGRGGIAGATLQGDAQAGQVTGNERFLRGARQPGQFVGSDTGDLPAALTQMATGGGRTNTGLNTRGNRGQNQFNGNQANVNSGGGAAAGGRGRNGRQPVYRTTRIVGFDYPTPRADTITVDFPQRVAKLPRFEGQKPVEVELKNRTAILRGVVATAHDRDLIERLALLEPGISQVQNELTVASTPDASIPAPGQATAE